MLPTYYYKIQEREWEFSWFDRYTPSTVIFISSVNLMWSHIQCDGFDATKKKYVATSEATPSIKTFTWIQTNSSFHSSVFISLFLSLFLLLFLLAYDDWCSIWRQRNGTKVLGKMNLWWLQWIEYSMSTWPFIGSYDILRTAPTILSGLPSPTFNAFHQGAKMEYLDYNGTSF